MTQLVGRRPVVAPAELIASLVPPPHFADARFDTYTPDPDFPSQGAALDAVRDFAKGVRKPARLRGGSATSAGRGLYLDGGFGVGKTHLLAALAHDAGKRAAFGTFVEYTHL